jgi:hypothetical protein
MTYYPSTVRPPKVERACKNCGGLLKASTKPVNGHDICTRDTCLGARKEARA